MAEESAHIPGQLSVDELEKLAHVYASYNGGYNGGGYGGGGYGEAGDAEEDAAQEEEAGAASDQGQSS